MRRGGRGRGAVSRRTRARGGGERGGAGLVGRAEEGAVVGGGGEPAGGAHDGDVHPLARHRLPPLTSAKANAGRAGAATGSCRVRARARRRLLPRAVLSSARFLPASLPRCLLLAASPHGAGRGGAMQGASGVDPSRLRGARRRGESTATKRSSRHARPFAPPSIAFSLRGGGGARQRRPARHCTGSA